MGVGAGRGAHRGLLGGAKEPKLKGGPPVLRPVTARPAAAA